MNFDKAVFFIRDIMTRQEQREESSEILSGNLNVTKQIEISDGVKAGEQFFLAS